MDSGQGRLELKLQFARVAIRFRNKVNIAIKGMPAPWNSEKFPQFGCSKFNFSCTNYPMHEIGGSDVQRGGGQTGRRPQVSKIRGIKRVKLQKLHFIKLLKMYAFSYRKSTNTCRMDLLGSCWEGMV